MGLRYNKMYKPREVQEFEMYVGWIAAQAMKIQGWEKTNKPVSMSLEVVFGDKRNRDLQNCFGSICDALIGIVYDDDSQIVFIAARKSYEKNKWGFQINIDLYKEKNDRETTKSTSD